MEKFKPDFEASTATELMLINKIRALEYQNELLAMKAACIPSIQQENPLEITSLKELPILHLPVTASVIGSIDIYTGNLKVICRINSKLDNKTYGYQYFIDPPLKISQIEPYLTHLHERYLNELAHELMK